MKRADPLSTQFWTRLWRDARRVSTLWCFYTAALLGLGWLGSSLLTPFALRSWDQLVNSLIHWDAVHILEVAREGYVMDNPRGPNLQILPAFPGLIRAFHFFIPPMLNSHWEVAQILAGLISSFFMVMFFSKLTRLDLNEKDSDLAVLLYLLFPTAFFFTVPYTESFYCACVFAMVYGFRTGRFGRGLALGPLAALIRISGVALIPGLLLEGWSQRELKGQYGRPARYGFYRCAGAVVLAYGFFLALNRVLQGHWFYYIEREKDWHMQLLAPFHFLIQAFAERSFSDPTSAVGADPINLLLMPSLTVGLLFCSVVLSYRRRLKVGGYFELGYCGSGLLILTCLSHWASLPRLVLPFIYPVFQELAPRLGKSPVKLALYCFASGSLLLVYWIRYLNYLWAF